MKVVVQKYGGSSVADVERLRAVARRIVATRESGAHVVAVVSAMGNTTNELLALARSVSEEPPNRELDMLVSVGERISMSLLSMAIQELGHQAVSFTGSQSGIITNVSHGRARVVEVRPYRIQDEVERGRIVIVAGFQGVSYQREITTLGRGGSDTTAICLAAALQADYCEICSDVDGVYTADPRVVPAAQRIAQMTHDEMLEMARAGAKVLNADAVEYARRHGIAIYARATTGPLDDAGTIVRRDLVLDRPEVTAVTGNSKLLRAHWSVRATSDSGAAQSWKAVLAQVDTGESGPLRAWWSGDRVELWFATENMPSPAGFTARLKARVPEAQVDCPVAVATAVGPNLSANPAVAHRALRCLEQAGIAVTGASSQPAAMSFTVAPEQLDDAVRALHGELIERW